MTLRDARSGKRSCGDSRLGCPAGEASQFPPHPAPVILSGVAGSRSEPAMQSKDPQQRRCTVGAARRSPRDASPRATSQWVGAWCNRPIATGTAEKGPHLVVCYRGRMHPDQSKATIRFILCVFACLISTATIRAQETKTDNPKQSFTGYPPTVYIHFFLACPGNKLCTQSDDFHVDPVPKGCCLLTVRNGDGRGTDEVSSYEVFLNGQRALPSGKARNAQTAVKVLQDNTLKVALIGGPHSKVLILLANDPRESK